MKKLALLATTLILTLALFTIATAQTSANSTQERTSRSVSEPDLATEQLVDRLIREVKPGRLLIESQQEQIGKMQKDSELQTENSASLERSYAAAQRENSALRLALESSKETIAAKNETIALVTSQRDEERTKRKKAEKQGNVAKAAAVALFLLRFF